MLDKQALRLRVSKEHAHFATQEWASDLYTSVLRLNSCRVFGCTGPEERYNLSMTTLLEIGRVCLFRDQKPFGVTQVPCLNA